MGGFVRPDQYVKKNWDKSEYRPRRMQVAASRVCDDINLTCSNLRKLSDAIVKISLEANSRYYSSYSRSLMTEIGMMNSHLSRTGLKTTEDLVRIITVIASRNKNLANSIKNVGENMLNDVSIIEKFYNDGSL